MELHAVVMKEGQRWRDLNHQDKKFKTRFLQSWEKYLTGEGQDEFLQLAKEYGYLIKQQKIEHEEFMKKIKPSYKRLERLNSLVNRSMKY